MRKIICLYVDEGNLGLEELEECSKHSYLVEPRNAQEVLVDLSCFKKIGHIIDAIAGQAASHSQKAVIGVAASPLLATIAARFYLHLPFQNNCYRIFQSHRIPVIRVLPDREAEFLADLPVEDFYPLSGKEQKLLKRMGYSRVGELVNLPPERMSQIIKRDAAILSQNCRGIDYMSVQGLYPPGRISYALTSGGYQDLIQFRNMIKALSIKLADKLKQKQASCCRVQVQVITAYGCQTWERTLTQACHEAVHLEHIIESLIQVKPEQAAAEEIRVVLTDLQATGMHMPDLFTWRRETPNNRCQLIRNVIWNLKQKYPDCIQVGIVPERREQILFLWDPWRGNYDKVLS